MVENAAGGEAGSPGGRAGVAPGALRWGIKQSLVSYVSGMADGRVDVVAPAYAMAQGEAVAGFVFPPAMAASGEAAAPDAATAVPLTEWGRTAPMRFAGTVTLTGHGGMLRLEFGNPALERAAGAGDWVLTVDDPHEPGGRLVFASVAGLVQTPGGGLRCEGTALTQDGADLFFFGSYEEGTALDDPEVVVGPEVADGTEAAGGTEALGGGVPE